MTVLSPIHPSMSHAGARPTAPAISRSALRVAGQTARNAAPALLALALIGCGSAGAEDRRTVSLAELGACATMTNAGGFETAPFYRPDVSCPWLELGAQTRLDIEHPLASPPSVVLVYVAFDPEGRSATMAAGDVARIVEATSNTVSVENATEQPLFARIYAQ